MANRKVSHNPLTDLYILPQDPRSTSTPVPVKVRKDILKGPVGRRVAVFDYNRDQDTVYEGAQPDKNGNFPKHKISDPRFHQLNTYAIAVRAIELVEMELGRELRWGFDASRLIILPHAGSLANAFYSEDTHSLQFYSFRSGPDKQVYHTSLSHDIVAHETGHAILDAVRDRYTEGLHPETSALHEAIADLTAVFAALSHDIILKKVAKKMEQANFISDIAEHFEGNHQALRNLLQSPKPESYWQKKLSPHDRSLKLTCAIYEALLALQKNRIDAGMDHVSALKLARKALQRMVVRGLDFLPPADGTFQDFGIAIIKADTVANPQDKFGFRKDVFKALKYHHVLAGNEPLLKQGRSPKPWPNLPPYWPRPTREDAYYFLYENRKRLAMWPRAEYRDFVLREAHYTKAPPQRRRRDWEKLKHSDPSAEEPKEDAIEHVILIYEYPVDVELEGSDFGAVEGLWLTIWGGGTLVFDNEGYLVHRFDKPVTTKRVQDIKAFIKDGIIRRLAAPTGNSLEDEIREDRFTLPWKLAVSADRVVLKSNPSARCYSGREKTEGRKSGRTK